MRMDHMQKCALKVERRTLLPDTNKSVNNILLLAPMSAQHRTKELCSTAFVFVMRKKCLNSQNHACRLTEKMNEEQNYPHERDFNRICWIYSLFVQCKIECECE